MSTYSVVITTHRRPLLLQRAIRSIKEQAAACQVVLVSDVACAETHAVAGALLSGTDLFIQRSGAPGPARSRNIGLAAASNDFILFLDDDDAFSPNFFGDIAGHATDSRVLYSDYYAFFERLDQGEPITVSGEMRSLAAHEPASVHVKNFIPLPCLVYPAAALKARRFDEDLVLNEDWDFILNVVQGCPLQHVPLAGPIVYSREVADNRGRRNDHLLLDTYRRVYRRYPAPDEHLRLDRQRLLASVGVAEPLADL